MTRPREGHLGRVEGGPEDRTELRAAAAGVVAGLGAFFAAHHLAGAGGGLDPATFYDVPFLLLSVAMLYAGYWLLTCDADHRRVSRIALWSLAGLLVLVAVGVWASGGRAGDLQAAVRLAVDVGTVGASSGLLVGLEGERRRRKLDEDAHLAADRADERLAFVNRLLRHHLLNGMAVVRGHAELLTEVCEDPPEAVDVIKDRCDGIADLIRDVETLTRAFTGDLLVQPTVPRPPLADAVRAAREAGAEVEFVDDGLDGRPVRANDRIGQVFRAAIDAAVEAAADDRVIVEAASDGGEFVAWIAFDGTLELDTDGAVQPGEYGDEEFDLFLAETVLEYFGGSLDLAEEDAGGALTLRLPFAD